MEPEKILKKYWGFDRFRPLQGEVIGSVLKGKDTLALMPTGGGKSLCFQVPALCMEGLCLVVTPLISLMKDQVAHLKEKGIPALAVYSGMHWREVEKTFKNALYGNFKFLYLSPERLTTALFLDYIEALQINLITVDEAHCISQWGYDFRPSYLQIGALRSYVPETAVLALTATATSQVREDIQDKLLFRQKNILVKSFFRHNLSYVVLETEAKMDKVADIVQKVPGSSIIFCRSRKRTKEVASRLDHYGLTADYYHGGLDTAVRNERQEAWINNNTRIMVCTNAFGMGIDKPDVRTVIHYDLPDSPEAYYQEAGRAGRDGTKSFAVLLCDRHEIDRLTDKIAIQYPAGDVIRKVYRALVSYLNVPAGSGEGIYYDFDLRTFAKVFKFRVLLVSHVLKILEQEEILAFSENISLPSRICFTLSKSDLYHFEKQYSAHVPMINCLLRTYPGIYDDYVPVSEMQVARILKIKTAQVVAAWSKLQSQGVLDYQPLKDKPQILFLQQRIAVDNLLLDIKKINNRKEAFSRRIEAMQDYASNKENCRSKLLLSYFDEKESLPCGICDVCLTNKKRFQTEKKEKPFQDEIVARLSDKTIRLPDLLAAYSPADKEFVLLTLRNLLNEGQLVIDSSLKLIWKGNN